MMFKILVLQALYFLSDEATELQIKDRLSFHRFLGLGLDGRVLDAPTVWLLRERLVLAAPIARVVEQGCRRVGPGKGTVIADVDP
jgi:IS5 family transposase